MTVKRPRPKPLNNAQLNKLVKMQAEKIQQLEDKIRELEAKLAGKNPTERLEESYSEKAENARKEKAAAKPPPPKNSKKPSRRGRITTAEKAKLAHRTEPLFPESVDRDLCSFSHTRVAWRLEDGKAVLIAYDIYRFQNQFGKISGVLGRSEFGIEIVIALAYQVYGLGLSMDKACAVLCFFQQLKLSKSQAEGVLVSDDAAVYQGFTNSQSTVKASG
jgi:hypothetical protein